MSATLRPPVTTTTLNSYGSPNKNSELICTSCLELLQARHIEEEKSYRLYENMYMYLENIGYTGAGALWHKYAHEELEHADWARAYLLSLGIQPKLAALPALEVNSFAGLPDVIKQSYKHEIEITQQCKTLAAAALKEGDHMLYQLALKYLTEQIEEQNKMQGWLDKLELFGATPENLRWLDKDMLEASK